MGDRSAEATTILDEVIAGDVSVAERLMPLVYDELRALAASFFRDQRVSHTLEPTALVHEAFVRLIGGRQVAWESRAHFFAVAAMAMRNVLRDHARRVLAEKRGGGWGRVTLAEGMVGSGGVELDPVTLSDVLDKLGRVNARQAEIVGMRFFGGLKVDQVAEVLSVSPRTVELDWRMARAWLRRELVSGDD